MKANVAAEIKLEEEKLKELNINIIKLLDIVLRENTGIAKRNDNGKISQNQLPSLQNINDFKENRSLKTFGVIVLAPRIGLASLTYSKTET